MDSIINEKYFRAVHKEAADRISGLGSSLIACVTKSATP